MSVLQGFGQPNLMPAPNIPNPQSSNVAANNTLSTLTALGAMGECAVVYLLHVGVFSDILELCCILRCFKHCQVNFCLNGFTIRIILFFFLVCNKGAEQELLFVTCRCCCAATVLKCILRILESSEFFVSKTV